LSLAGGYSGQDRECVYITEVGKPLASLSLERPESNKKNDTEN